MLGVVRVTVIQKKLTVNLTLTAQPMINEEMNVNSANNLDQSIQLNSLNLAESTTAESVINQYSLVAERAKGTNKEYEFVKTYPSLLDAQEGVKAKEIGEQAKEEGGIKYETKAGDKICYTCGGFPKCPKRPFAI